MNRYAVAMLVAVASAAAFSQAPDPAAVRRTAMIEQTAAEVQRLGENFDIVSDNQSKLEAKVMKLEGDLKSIEDLKAEIAGLRAENERLRNQQAELRKQIVDDITAKIAKMNLGGGSAPAPAQPSFRPVNTAGRNATPPPPVPSTPAPATSGYNHIVEAGQTLSEIARGYGVTVSAIKQANGLKSDNLRIGQKLFIPDPPKK